MEEPQTPQTIEISGKPYVVSGYSLSSFPTWETDQAKYSMSLRISEPRLCLTTIGFKGPLRLGYKTPPLETFTSPDLEFQKLDEPARPDSIRLMSIHSPIFANERPALSSIVAMRNRRRDPMLETYDRYDAGEALKASSTELPLAVGTGVAVLSFGSSHFLCGYTIENVPDPESEPPKLIHNILHWKDRTGPDKEELCPRARLLMKHLIEASPGILGRNYFKKIYRDNYCSDLPKPSDIFKDCLRVRDFFVETTSDGYRLKTISESKQQPEPEE